jgi:hypothetical protein
LLALASSPKPPAPNSLAGALSLFSYPLHPEAAQARIKLIERLWLS